MFHGIFGKSTIIRQLTKCNYSKIKKNTVLYFWALYICFDCKIKGEQRVIRDFFLKNGYFDEVIYDNIILNVIEFRNKNKIIVPSKYPVYSRLPWIAPASQSFVNKIDSSVSRCFNVEKVRSIFTSREEFNSTQKHVLPLLNQSLLI